MKKIVSLLIVGLLAIIPLYCYANIAKGLSGSCKWVIDDNGVLTITPISGEEGRLEDWGKGISPWFEYYDKITHAKFEKEIYAKTCFSMFRNCYNLETVDLGQLNIDESDNMQYMFSGCESLKEIDMSTLNTDNVVYMDNMFAYCSSLKSIDLSTFDTFKVITMNQMFYNCTSLEYADVSRFWTLNLAEAREMFFNCKKLKNVNMHFWDFRGMVNMTSMFQNCESLKYINIHVFSLSRGDIDRAFMNCHSLESLNLTGIYPGVGEYSDGLFTGCESLKKFYALNNDPFMWTISENVFKTIKDPGKIILYVHREAVDLYKNAPGWSIFDVRAVEDEPKESDENTENKQTENPEGKTTDNPEDKPAESPVTGIDIATSVQSSVAYTLSGKRLVAPRNGVNIINGKKYLVK